VVLFLPGRWGRSPKAGGKFYDSMNRFGSYLRAGDRDVTGLAELREFQNPMGLITDRAVGECRIQRPLGARTKALISA
jgi:hypothetical protein